MFLAADWKGRIDACQRIQAIAFMFDGVCSGSLSKINVSHYIVQVNKFGNVLAVQVSVTIALFMSNLHMTIFAPSL